MQNPSKMVDKSHCSASFWGEIYGLLHGKSLGKSSPDQPRFLDLALFQKGALKSLAAFSTLKLPFRGNSTFSDTSIFYIVFR